MSDLKCPLCSNKDAALFAAPISTGYACAACLSAARANRLAKFHGDDEVPAESARFAVPTRQIK